MKSNYLVDFNSLMVTAESEEQARERAMELLEEGENVEISNITNVGNGDKEYIIIQQGKEEDDGDIITRIKSKDRTNALKKYMEFDLMGTPLIVMTLESYNNMCMGGVK